MLTKRHHGFPPPFFFDMPVYRIATDNKKVTENCDSYSHWKIDLSFATVIFGSTLNIKSLLYIAIIQWLQKRIIGKNLAMEKSYLGRQQGTPKKKAKRKIQMEKMKQTKSVCVPIF